MASAGTFAELRLKSLYFGIDEKSTKTSTYNENIVQKIMKLCSKKSELQIPRYNFVPQRNSPGISVGFSQVRRLLLVKSLFRAGCELDWLRLVGN